MRITFCLKAIHHTSLRFQLSRRTLTCSFHLPLAPAIPLLCRLSCSQICLLNSIAVSETVKSEQNEKSKSLHTSLPSQNSRRAFASKQKHTPQKRGIRWEGITYFTQGWSHCGGGVGLWACHAEVFKSPCQKNLALPRVLRETKQMLPAHVTTSSSRWFPSRHRSPVIVTFITPPVPVAFHTTYPIIHASRVALSE